MSHPLFILTIHAVHLYYSEENSTIPGVGVDQLLKDGKLKKFKDGPIFWVDSADMNPRIGNHIVSLITQIYVFNSDSFCFGLEDED